MCYCFCFLSKGKLQLVFLFYRGQEWISKNSTRNPDFSNLQLWDLRQWFYSLKINNSILLAQVGVMDWFVSLLNLYVEVLAPSTAIFGDRAFKVERGHTIGAVAQKDRKSSATQKEASPESRPTEPWSWTSGFQNCEKISVFCSRHPVCGVLWWWPERTKTVGLLPTKATETQALQSLPMFPVPFLISELK